MTMTTDSEIGKLCEEVEEYCSKATPGEWKSAARLGDDWDSVVFIPETPLEICQCFHERGNEDQCEANARFIARARTDLPKLLSLLRARMEEDRWIPVTERLPEMGRLVEIPPILRGDKWFTYEVSDWVETWNPNGIAGDDDSHQSKRMIQRRMSYSKEAGNWIHGGVTAWRPLPSVPEVQG